MSTTTESTTASAWSRRRFLVSSTSMGGGLVIGFLWPAAARAHWVSAPAQGESGHINAFIEIAADGTVTFVMPKSEMGQGVYTGLSQLLAEELECGLSTVRIVTAPVAKVYDNPFVPAQFTGGSLSISTSWQALRLAGAIARTMLIEAAATRWGVAPSLCHAQHNVVHGPAGRTAGYGELAAAAGKLVPPDPKAVKLKGAGDFTLIGKPVKRIEAREKVDGSGKFGLDVRVPGMLRAMLARPPALGATPRHIDDSEALKVRDVLRVVPIAAGVAVVARNTYAARVGRDKLKIEWLIPPGAILDTREQGARYRKLAASPGPLVARHDGDAAASFSAAGARLLEATYEVPYLSHSPMEPLNCAAHWQPDRCDVWTGTQMQSGDRAAAAKLAGLPDEKVFIHTMLLGGGFGRRANPAGDFVSEAVELSRAIEAPVQVVWTREDDMHGGWYRPMWTNRLRAALGADGRPEAWQHTLVGQSIMSGTSFAGAIKNGIDPTSVQGAADLPYAIPNLNVDLHTTSAPVRVLWWRSVGHSNTAFAVEGFIDECATAAGADPLAYRRAMLTGPKQARHRAVLEMLAEKSGWGKPLPKGHAHGLALHAAMGSVVGEVAEVSIENGRPRVHRVVAVIHCGLAVNPQLVAAQLESAVIFGLSAALYGEITYSAGKPGQSNFDTYPVVRIAEAPRVEAHIVPSEDSPTGVGEPGTPPIAPAVANAIFALTGRRIRSLPMLLNGKFKT
ncbi:MAG: xanthine dehydrogenase family protein molybdopterin-binding subunit [Steroidobacteraceae bacterium]|nr:xanthine dehydrogenase family protein molybdopterin-binding subunit [Steroidobacteraceae bacterium]